MRKRKTTGYDQRRRDVPWRKWYRRKEWLRRRQMQLAEHPLCASCLRRSTVRPATEVHHVTPHRGDWDLFVGSELESLCAECHGRETRGETNGTVAPSRDIDPRTGLPTDPAHPWRGT